MPMLPPDLQDLLEQIDAADRAGAALGASVTDEQFRWRPQEGRGWSIAQCLDHLALINTHYAAAVRRGVDEGRRKNLRRDGPARPTFWGRWFIESQEPPVKIKLKAPKVARSPENKAREEILRAYHQAHDTVRQLIVDGAEIDLNRSTFQNPFLPIVRMRVGTGLLILAAHDRRHLWQAEQVKIAPGFPSRAST